MKTKNFINIRWIVVFESIGTVLAKTIQPLQEGEKMRIFIVDDN